jgi:tetratricopeptide (TPR) repeat protein
VALARECRLEQHEGEARMLLASFYMHVGQIDLADEHAGAVIPLARRFGNRPAHAFALIIQAAARLTNGATDETAALLSQAERESSGNPPLEAQVAYQMGLSYTMREDFPRARERLETALKTIREHGFIEQEAITRLLLALIDYSTPERQHRGLQAMEAAMTFVETHAERLEVAGLQTEVFRQYLEQMQAEQSGQGAQSVESLVTLLLRTTDWSTFEMLVRANVARLQGVQLDDLFAAALEEASARSDEVARRVLRAFRSFLGWCVEEGGVETALRRARTSFESDYLYAWWGRVNRSNGAYYRALISLNRALELAPDSPQHLVERAWAYRGLGSYSRALEDLRRAQELRPEAAEPSLALAVLSYELGDLETALQQIERASQHERDPYSQQWRGSILLRRGDYAGALASLSQAVEQDRRNTEHYYWRALARLAAGDMQGAIDDLDRLVELDYAEPAKQFYSLCWRGLAHNLAADESLAEGDWARAAQLTASLPANDQQQFALGLLAAMRRDLAAARSHYEKAMRNHYTRHRLVSHVQHIRLLERLRRHQPGLADLVRWLGEGSAHAAV